MLCCHWNKETFFCKLRKRVINPEELDICENCIDYKKLENVEDLFCVNCQESFQLSESGVVLIKGKEFAKCPICGEVIGVDTTDSVLR